MGKFYILADITKKVLTCSRFLIDFVLNVLRAQRTIFFFIIYKQKKLENAITCLMVTYWMSSLEIWGITSISARIDRVSLLACLCGLVLSLLLSLSLSLSLSLCHSLNIIDDPLHRRDYTKFRISNHNLMIEYGRYGNTKVPKESRLCLVCNTNQIEDELHLIFSCSCYNEHRTKMINDFKNKTNKGSCQNYQEIHFLTEIIQSKIPSVIRLFCKFIANCFYERKCKLDA